MPLATPFQGRGIATAAARQIAALARAQHLHAFPAADHPASNAVCRKASFTLLGETDVEYPPGSIMRCSNCGWNSNPRTQCAARRTPGKRTRQLRSLLTNIDHGSRCPARSELAHIRAAAVVVRSGAWGGGEGGERPVVPGGGEPAAQPHHHEHGD